MGAFVGNPVQISYTYGNDINNTVIVSAQESTVLLYNPLVTVDVFTNREYAHMGDKIQYKIVIKNIGNVKLFNNYVKFPLDSSLEIIPNTICVDGKRKEVNLKDIPIPDLLVGSSECIIIFTTIVTKNPFCQFYKVKSSATVFCTYDINSNLEVTSGIAETFIQKPYKSFRIKEKLIIPKVMPSINRILSCDVYLLSVCPITICDNHVYIKISYAAEIIYRDCSSQKITYYQTYERYINFCQGYYPYLVCISINEKEMVDEDNRELKLLIGVRIYDKIASGRRK